jgi:hypothetical protein
VIRGRLVLPAAFLLCVSAAHAELRAERITQATAALLSVGGPDAIGGIGDWWLANDVVEAVIDDVGREHGKLNHGGTLVDLGLRERSGEDQFARLFPLVNLSQRIVVGYDAIRAEVDPAGGYARIVVTSPGLQPIPRGGFFARALDPLVPDAEDVAAVRVETVYELRPRESFVRIATTLTNAGESSAPVFAFGDVWMRGGRSGRGFVGDALAPESGRAWDHRDFDGSLGALTRFTHMSLVGTPDFPAIAYALYAPERAARGLPLFGFAGEHASLAFALVGDPPDQEPGAWAFARALFRDLAPGASWRFDRRVLVAGRRDVAATTDPIFEALGVLDASGFEGEVQLSGRRGVLIVETPGGVPITQLALEASAGTATRFSASLPPGDYQAVLRAEHAAEQRVPLQVREEVVSRLGLPGVPPPARLVFAPAFADGGPGRVEVRGIGDTADPVFRDDLLGTTLDGAALPSATATSAIVFLGDEGRPLEVAIAPGRYRLTATRGLDWEIASVEVDVAADGVRVAVPPFALEALEPLVGFVSADLHVHAEASDDSQTPNEDRLRRYVAEGIDVMVATDHDHVSNYAPAMAALGIGDRLRVVQGVEVTSSTPSSEAPWTIGHHNAWPIARRPHAHRQGAPPSQNRGVGALYAELRADYGARVVQLNHPRPTPTSIEKDDLNGDYFAHGEDGRAFDPTLPLDHDHHAAYLRPTGEGDTTALDFDAIELMNGTSYPRYLAIRDDWYALLRQGLRPAATANSDTHAPGELAAYPRNYVRVGPEGDAPERFDAAIRTGRSFGTTGPRIRRLTVNGATLGDLVAPENGHVHVEYEVDAPSWVPVDEVRLLVNGEVVHVGPEREGSLDLTFEQDGFITLEAGAPLDAEAAEWIEAHPGPYTEVLVPGFVATALSNPVWVDVDGDGVFDAPGL